MNANLGELVAALDGYKSSCSPPLWCGNPAPFFLLSDVPAGRVRKSQHDEAEFYIYSLLPEPVVNRRGTWFGVHEHGLRTSPGQPMEIAMNWDIFAGRWKQHKGNLKVRWGKFNDDHFGVIDGRRIQLSGRTQETYGISREKMRNKQRGST